MNNVRFHLLIVEPFINGNTSVKQRDLQYLCESEPNFLTEI